ncbi:hypothetical protein SKAU_G00160300 [Synaphobranchus kaupii]|uniref:Sulfatase N-terminal domain-containing protein n=1 Tax=Synaphobranchus kaupii TaxID=118154 RepID=A0A9Q1IZQ1_SYNKA|nr:hypothetical protein SKAU_G00160300 [Synaphobranchus kaupii]
MWRGAVNRKRPGFALRGSTRHIAAGNRSRSEGDRDPEKDAACHRALGCLSQVHPGQAPKNPGSRAPGSAHQPHLIFIMVDDQGYNDVGYHGSLIHTPVLDRLARKGVTLENYYVQPICSPSRSQLMTGRYQIHTGLQHSIIRPRQPVCLPPDAPTLPERLRDVGYSTHMVGKWHLGFSRPGCLPTGRGFRTFLGSLTGSGDHYTFHNCDGSETCGFDLHDGQRPAWELSGNYSTLLYAQRPQHQFSDARQNGVLPQTERLQVSGKASSSLMCRTTGGEVVIDKMASDKTGSGEAATDTKRKEVPPGSGENVECIRRFWRGLSADGRISRVSAVLFTAAVPAGSRSRRLPSRLPRASALTAFHITHTPGADIIEHDSDGPRSSQLPEPLLVSPPHVIGAGREVAARGNVQTRLSQSACGPLVTPVLGSHFYQRLVKQILRAHDHKRPLFLYLAFQAVHTPLQAPARFLRQYRSLGNLARRHYAAMLSCVDEAVGEVVQELRDRGLYRNSVLVYSSDNGGQPLSGGCNWPLRGGKGTYWEGGVRAVGFVHSPLLKRKGVASVGWTATTCGPPSARGAPSPRTEILFNIDPVSRRPGRPNPRTLRAGFGIWDTAVRASIRVGDWKLLTGKVGDGDWVPPWNEPGGPARWEALEKRTDQRRKSVWLFNITGDPFERCDLSKRRPGVVRALLGRLAEYNQTAVPPRNPPDDPLADPQLHEGVWTPWLGRRRKGGGAAGSRGRAEGEEEGGAGGGAVSSPAFPAHHCWHIGLSCS